MSDLLRVYEEAGADGYPPAWHRCPTCTGSGWVCAATGEGVSRACALSCGGSCPSSDGCPSCTAPGAYGGAGSVKALVRATAGDRCVRCHHPYRKGDGEWSACDKQCTHFGPFRHRLDDGSWVEHPRSQGITPYMFARRGIPVEAEWRILTVHHLRTGDEAKRDLRWWNLAALCQRCHLEIQRKVVMDRPWPWEHTEWMRPYVAGFYALKYGGEDLGREEVEARLGELLELGARAEAVERMPL